MLSQHKVQKHVEELRIGCYESTVLEKLYKNNSIF